MNSYQEVEEMTDLEIRTRYGKLIEEASHAFKVDANYAADVAKKAAMIEARQGRGNA